MLGGYLVGYAATKTAEFVFKRPSVTIAALGLTGIMLYGACSDRTAGFRQDMLNSIAEARQEEQIGVIAEKPYNYYYVKQDDTPSGIALATTGDANNHHTLMRDNGLRDAQDLTAGMLLRVRKEFSTDNVYTQVPDLHSVVLPGNIKISDRFPGKLDEILKLNAELGLEYEDTFPYDERVVWYR